MASYAHDDDGFPIEAEEVNDIDRRNVFTCIKCNNTVHHVSGHIRNGYTPVRAHFNHNESSPDCDLYLGGHEVPPGYKPRRKIQPRFQYDENNEKIKIQSQTIDNANSKIFVQKKQDFFNLSIIISLSITPESADYYEDGKLQIASKNGTREILLDNIKNSSKPISAFDIDSEFNKNNIQIENCPPFINKAFQDNIINLRDKEIWILKDPLGTGFLFEGSRISLNYGEKYGLLNQYHQPISIRNYLCLQF